MAAPTSTLRTLLAAALFAAPLLAASTDAQDTFTTQVVVEGLNKPVWAGAPPGDGRVFVLEQNTSRILLVHPDGTASLFLDLSDRVYVLGYERGLRALAFHPLFASNGLFYVAYTAQPDGDVRLERFRVSADPDVADAQSGLVLLEESLPDQFHSGGDLEFGPDGMLYFGMGDGGYLAPCLAQEGDSLLGKLLRLDVDGGTPYAIPPDNPFVDDPGVRDEVWHLGLRQPWRFGFDPEGGALYLPDVGEYAQEEINVVPAGVGGLNFGWPEMEGDYCTAYDCGAAGCLAPSYTAPTFTYDHATLFGCKAVVGGEVYRGCALPALQGRFFYGDFCDAELWSFRWDPQEGVSELVDHTDELQSGAPVGGVASIGRDGYGEILLVDSQGPGRVLRLVPTTPAVDLIDCDGDGLHDPCVIAQLPALDLDSNGELDACQSFSAASGALSLSQGGVQPMRLHAGAQQAGATYVIAGSASGSCCLSLGGALIPLALDDYSFLLFDQLGQLPIAASPGVLDAAGQAEAFFVVWPGQWPASLAGTHLFHAYVLLGADGWPVFASNPLRLDLLP